jgi:hypothetical protein
MKLLRLSEALDETVPTATVARPLSVTPVDPRTLKPAGRPMNKPLAPGHSVVIIGRERLHDVRALAAGDEQAIGEIVWLAPTGGGQIFSLGIPTGDTFEANLTGLGELPSWSLPKDIQQAISAFKSGAHRRVGLRPGS